MVRNLRIPSPLKGEGLGWGRGPLAQSGGGAARPTPIRTLTSKPRGRRPPPILPLAGGRKSVTVHGESARDLMSACN